MKIHKICKDNRYFIFYVQEYVQLESIKKDTAKIDAYYFASNQIYHYAKSQILELEKLNINAKIQNHLDYKSVLLEHTQDYLRGDNHLLISKEFGTRIAVICLELFGDFEKSEFDSNIYEYEKCVHCGKCKAACKTKALDSENFCREKCMREQMDGDFTAEQGILFENFLLGCDICQSVCPYNKKDTTTYPPELAEKLRYDYLIKCINDKSKLEFLTGYIGKNYIKVERLSRLIENGFKNQK